MERWRKKLTAEIAESRLRRETVRAQRVGLKNPLLGGAGVGFYFNGYPPLTSRRAGDGVVGQIAPPINFVVNIATPFEAPSLMTSTRRLTGT